MSGTCASLSGAAHRTYSEPSKAYGGPRETTMEKNEMLTTRYWI